MVRRSKGFGERICGVNDAGDMGKKYLLIGFPFLDCKMLDVDVAQARGRLACVNHKDGSSIILVERSRSALRIPQSRENGTCHRWDRQLPLAAQIGDQSTNGGHVAMTERGTLHAE
jgi:hypothetical protein